MLSTSRDDTLRIWDAKQDLNELVSMKHYNNTGRWVVPFRAVWGPASDTVICGSMKRTVCISSTLFSKLNGRLTQTIASGTQPTHQPPCFWGRLLGRGISGQRSVWRHWRSRLAFGML